MGLEAGTRNVPAAGDPHINMWPRQAQGLRRRRRAACPMRASVGRCKEEEEEEGEKEEEKELLGEMSDMEVVPVLADGEADGGLIATGNGRQWRRKRDWGTTGRSGGNRTGAWHKSRTVCYLSCSRRMLGMDVETGLCRVVFVCGFRTIGASLFRRGDGVEGKSCNQCEGRGGVHSCG